MNRHEQQCEKALEQNKDIQKLINMIHKKNKYNERLFNKTHSAYSIFVEA